MFFFEKRTKNFYSFMGIAGRQRAPWPNKSLIASFSSEKEDLPFYSAPLNATAPATSSARAT
jgi:hypothetical protein